MSEAFVGEIRLFSGNYAPEGWHICDGTVLSVTDYQVLYSLIGNTYGGTAPTTFAIPDLRSRVALGVGQGTGLTNRALGQTGGTETVQLTQAQMPGHTHTMMASPNGATAQTPGPSLMLAAAVNTGGAPNKDIRYVPSTVTVGAKLAMGPTAIQSAGNDGSHANIMPSKAMTYIICLAGLYPQFN
jgi:microcystin-dependent protein